MTKLINEVTYSLKESIFKEIMIVLERIINANTEYKRDQLDMANNTIESMQKDANLIKSVLEHEFFGGSY